MAKQKKPGKALERVAREIKDSDEFVTHVGNISQRYRAEHELDAGPRKSAVRQSLKTLQKHADAVSVWLKQSQRSGAANVEREALGRIGTSLQDAQWLALNEVVTEWLSVASAAAQRCIDADKVAPRQAVRAAPRVAAEALRATFEYHKLKLSAQASAKKQGDAVRLLVAIAKNAGDAVLTAQDARQALLASGGSSRIKVTS